MESIMSEERTPSFWSYVPEVKEQNTYTETDELAFAQKAVNQTPETAGKTDAEVKNTLAAVRETANASEGIKTEIVKPDKLFQEAKEDSTAQHEEKTFETPEASLSNAEDSQIEGQMTLDEWNSMIIGTVETSDDVARQIEEQVLLEEKNSQDSVSVLPRDGGPILTILSFLFGIPLYPVYCLIGLVASAVSLALIFATFLLSVLGLIGVVGGIAVVVAGFVNAFSMACTAVTMIGCGLAAVGAGILVDYISIRAFGPVSGIFGLVLRFLTISPVGRRKSDEKDN